MRTWLLSWNRAIHTYTHLYGAPCDHDAIHCLLGSKKGHLYLQSPKTAMGHFSGTADGESDWEMSDTLMPMGQDAQFVMRVLKIC